MKNYFKNSRKYSLFYDRLESNTTDLTNLTDDKNLYAAKLF